MSTRPAWSEVPEWANFLARDADGSWFAYANEPEIADEPGMWSNTREGRFECVLPGNWDDWQETLHDRREEGNEDE